MSWECSQVNPERVYFRSKAAALSYQVKQQCETGWNHAVVPVSCLEEPEVLYCHGYEVCESVNTYDTNSLICNGMWSQLTSYLEQIYSRSKT